MGTIRTDYIIDEPLLEVGTVLGEGPLYDQRNGVLHFVDIPENKVYHLDIATNEVKVEAYPDNITCLALHPSDPSILACAATNGFGYLRDGKLTYLVEPIPEDDRPFTRFNDGACDSRGRFFAGTLCSINPSHPVAGMLYRYSPLDGSCVVVDKGPFTDSNGIGWSTDERTLYFTDSWRNHIHAYDYDIETGHISNRRVLVDAAKPEYGLKGTCDGLCVDTEGGIWSARWEGSKIVRFLPDGTPDFAVSVPKVWRVTACCFGGPNNDQLYVTSAHCAANGCDPTVQDKYPQSGHLFKLDLKGRFQGRDRYGFGFQSLKA
ncbi:hypothetical protein CYLTODRAFT_450859 [Cylindrobasidium torrendii FP15055 ss-10]|uniref:SMP-30/Gluconolactonase/LRE-like region domain-containing protein n=1 Tax=Cylindrobasidium torrendii FP15055 ss-10 TaxID=1314674 RepID=A0A0D7BMH9_9AGAR|nr:hypothetical protein CYLTODRAFT_450859 [Cylindrobasidium torrendii FP15055 ss-10]